MKNLRSFKILAMITTSFGLSSCVSGDKSETFSEPIASGSVIHGFVKEVSDQKNGLKTLKVSFYKGERCKVGKDVKGQFVYGGCNFEPLTNGRLVIGCGGVNEDKLAFKTGVLLDPGYLGKLMRTCWRGESENGIRMPIPKGKEGLYDFANISVNGLSAVEIDLSNGPSLAKSISDRKDGFKFFVTERDKANVSAYISQYEDDLAKASAKALVKEEKYNRRNGEPWANYWNGCMNEVMASLRGNRAMRASVPEKGAQYRVDSNIYEIVAKIKDTPL